MVKGLRIEQRITSRQDNSLKLYFKDVSKQSLITPEEEIKLAKLAKKGDQDALNKLVLANLRFVISVAKQYQNKGLNLVDLIQEGNYGLIQAVQSFDETRGFKFISYAVWWIRQSITKAISQQCRTVRLPLNQINYLNKINKVTTEFSQKYGRPPSDEELKELSGLEDNQISFTTNPKFTYLDNTFKDDETGSFLDVIPDTTAESPDEHSLSEEHFKELITILDKLSYRDRDIIKMSFGIGMSPMQFEEIANRFGISIERVRQLQIDILKELRSKYSEELKELI